MAGPYELYLIRHGLAAERGDAWPDDAKRPLTERGMSRLRKGARGLARLGVSLDVVLTSPLVRTRQTAEIVAGAFDPHPPLVNVDGLAPGGSYQWYAKYPAPPASVKSLTFYTRWTPPFDDVPITDK